MPSGNMYDRYEPYQRGGPIGAIGITFGKKKPGSRTISFGQFKKPGDKFFSISKKDNGDGGYRPTGRSHGGGESYRQPESKTYDRGYQQDDYPSLSRPADRQPAYETPPRYDGGQTYADGRQDYFEDDYNDEDQSYAGESSHHREEYYQEEEGYQDNGGYQNQRSYQDDGRYSDQRSYQDEDGYSDQRSYRDEDGYSDQRSYRDEDVYSDQRSYQDEDNYSDHGVYR
ncbi:hypothetical protein MMC09_001565 [Bachmanniomyces sp. S44760]|nr:hypothetical protein [Bachmanniomyces sp. S44760]